jgi:hypothetical protein
MASTGSLGRIRTSLGIGRILEQKGYKVDTADRFQPNLLFVYNLYAYFSLQNKNRPATVFASRRTSPLPIPRPDDVKAILNDFHARIRSIIDDAWKEWLDIPWRGKLVFTKRARAMLVFDFVVRRAREAFDGDPNIRVIVKHQTVKFLFKDKLLIRFKKSSEKGIGSNIMTQAVLDFVDPQRTIPDLVFDIMKVEVCYRPDELGISLEEVAVVARTEHARIWAYPLDRAGGTVVPLPIATPDESPAVVIPRQPRSDRKAEDEGE